MTTITPGTMAASPGDVREAIRMWILQTLALDPANVSSIEFAEGDTEGEAVLNVTCWQPARDDDGVPLVPEELEEVTLQRPLTTPLPFELDQLPEDVDTTAESLDPDELVDNPQSGRPSDTAPVDEEVNV